MGSRIEQRGKKGTWWYVGFYNGRVYRESLKTTSRPAAEREQRLRDVRYSDPSTRPPKKLNPEVGDFWASYEAWARENRRSRTIETQRRFWEVLVEFTGAERMNEIRRGDFERLKTARKRLGTHGWSEQTVNNALKDYQAIWNRGIREGWISGGNPVIDVERFTITTRKPTFHTREALERLVEVAEGMHNRDLSWAILLMGYAGLRRNEMASLRWEHMDFTEQAPVIKIRDSYDFRVKTAEERDIPMHRRIFEALYPHRKDDGYILGGGRRSAGKHRYRYDPQRSLREALDLAGLPKADPFQRLRRTFGSILVQQGVSIFKVARWMGHSVRVCERHYAGLLQHDPDIDLI